MWKLMWVVVETELHFWRFLNFFFHISRTKDQPNEWSYPVEPTDFTCEFDGTWDAESPLADLPITKMGLTIEK